MKLSTTTLSEKAAWEKAGFDLPGYDRAKIAANTAKAPTWVHFGAGNIFRAFPAAAHQRLLDQGKSETGVIVAEAFDREILDTVYRPFDNLSVLVVLKSSGTIEKKVLGSVVEALAADVASSDWARLREIFRAPSLQMASLTVTEKGYALKNAAGEYGADVVHDLEKGFGSPRSLMGKLTLLCYERYRAGASPLALVSMDNFSHNGTVLHESVRALALAWRDAGFVEAGFVGYVDDPGRLSFPWSMIDKITPRPDAGVKTMLEKDGFEDAGIVVTAKGTWTSAFVNAEEAEYLVVEDRFPNGRPQLEAGGVIFADRDTVDRAEKMKVCTCLNPLHTALAVYGCLLSYTSIHAEMADPQLRALVERLGYREGLPVVVDPGLIRPADFLREVLEKRLPNPFLPDTPQRIASDTSLKLPIRFGETLKAYRARPDLRLADLVGIPLVFAGWCRYLLGIDDDGRPFEPSPDPRLPVLRARFAAFRLGDTGPFRDLLAPILSDASIFGADLYEIGLGEKVEGYFAELLSGKGAVRETLKKYLKT